MSAKKKPKQLKSKGKLVLQWVEIFLGVIVLAAVIAASVATIAGMVSADWGSLDAFSFLLKRVLELAIGVELARLLFSYSMETIIELAVFVVARKLLLLDGEYLSLLLGIIALVLLVATRRLLIDDDARVTTFFKKEPSSNS